MDSQSTYCVEQESPCAAATDAVQKARKESRRPRVVFYAPSTGGAMAHALQSLVPELSLVCDVLLVTPEHYRGCADHRPQMQFASGNSKLRRGLREANFLSAWTLFRQILAWKPDVVHLFNGEGYPWTILLACLFKRARVPVLLTVHDTSAHPGFHAAALLDWLIVTLRSVTYRFSTALHLFSASCREQLPAAATALPAHYLPHWTTADQFLRHRREGIRREHDLIVFFGRIQPYKGLLTLVKATVLLNGRFRTVLAGGGEIDAESQRLIAEHPGWFVVQNRYVPDEEIAVLLQRAAICALPYTHVTQSSVPMIAAAFGVPVVASRLGSFQEDILPANGCLVPPSDAEAFARAVLEAVDKRPEPLAERALPVVTESLLRIYRALLLESGSLSSTRSNRRDILVGTNRTA